MSRAATGDIVAIRPTANIYTVLVLAGVIAQFLALIVMFVRSRETGISFF